MLVHAAFDILAFALAALTARLQLHFRLLPPKDPAIHTWDYLAALVAAAAVGAYGFGSLNLMLSGVPGIGRSIEGAIAGAIVGVEIYKRARGITARTGASFALPLSVGIAVGRIGCFLSGLDDMTHGTPTTLPWGHDFGDGIPRHPVQLYESASMALWACGLTLMLRRSPARAARHAFHLTIAVYAAQRFIWEFWKPYGTLIGPLTVFHLLSAALLAYALIWLIPSKEPAAS